MIIFIDLFSNCIIFNRNEAKNVKEYFYVQKFNYSLTTLDNKVKAINEINNEELSIELKKERVHDLIISDDILGLGTFDIPVLSRSRMNDVFNTHFRLCYSNPNAYFVNSFEYSREDKNAIYFYEFAKRSTYNSIINAFKNKGISFKNVNTFASLFANSDKKGPTNYPTATLIIGDYRSELIVSKGSTIFGINSINYGSKVFFEKDSYLNSAFNFNNDEALMFSGFLKENIVNREELNDENIFLVEKEKGLSYSEPKELRLLKDEHLAIYNYKNAFRKFYARLEDIIEIYAKTPWFFPLKDIYVIASKEVVEGLIEASHEDENINFIDKEISINDLIKKGINKNTLFSKGISKERRKIDWGKLLTMEIGKKKA